MKRRRMLRPSSLRGLKQMGDLRWTRHYIQNRNTARNRVYIKKATHKADRQAALWVARDEMGSGDEPEPIG